MGREYHLWREYPTAPFLRWACDLVEDHAHPDGFRVTRSDPLVAAPEFLLDVAHHIARPHLVNHAPDVTAQGIGESWSVVPAGTPGHFDEAIRTVPNSEIRPMSGRAT